MTPEIPTDPLFSISGKTILVTGASSGIGLHLLRTLASRGATVVAASRSSSRSEALAALAAEMDGRVVPQDMDITAEASVEAAFTGIAARFGRLDALVNSAGIAEPKRTEDMSLAEWQRTIDTNLTGAFLVSREAARLMTEGGSIVLVASIGAYRSVVGLSSYSASKAGVVMLARTLAIELAGRAIRTNVLVPGYVLTPMNEEFLSGPAGAKILKKVPLNRFAKPADLDAAAIYLCSDGSAYVTGSTIAVDGGFLA